MAYCTQSDVQMSAGGSARLQKLSDWEGRGRVDADVVAAASAAASARIKEYLQKRFDIDLEDDDIPQGIRDIAAAEAVFEMKSRRDMVNEADMQLHQERELRLADIAKGMRTVGTDPLPAKSSLVVDRQSARPSDKSVSRDATKGFW